MTRATRRKRRASRGTLVTVTALLIGSAGIRLGGEMGPALAREAEEDGVPEGAAAEPVCESPQDLRGLMAAFSTREERLQIRETALEDRMQALRVADKAVTERLAELERAESALREVIALADTAAEDDLSRLTKVYENMKPQQAAALFEQMDPNFAAGFLGRMRPEAAAEIMAGLSSEAAHAFSVVLAGRNAEVPRE